MKNLTAVAIEVVEKEKIKFWPKKWEKTYFHWLSNIQDWCISRQLWWGHRIPVYYCSSCPTVQIVSKHRPDKCPNCNNSDNLYQDNDVLDTWFSSWLWAYGVHKTEEEENYFYPTDLLITGPDIIFFWVARMIIAGLEYKKDIPFKNVYFNGIVRDEKGRKMSKSLGNSPDPLDIIREYGADALRFTMIRLTPVGNDVLFSKDKCEIGRNFANKIWNVSRFILMYKEKFPSVKKELDSSLFYNKWIISRLHNTIMKVEDSVKQFMLNDAIKFVYEFIWNDYCDWYVEIIKERLNSGEKETMANALYVFEEALKLLHPFMPFITEELWQLLDIREKNSTILNELIPEFSESLISLEVENLFENLKEAVSKIRNIKIENSVSKEIEIIIKSSDERFLSITHLIKSLTKTKEPVLDLNYIKKEGDAGFMIDNTIEFFALDVIDIEKEKEKIEKEIERLLSINKGILAKLNNESFVNNAPVIVIEREKEKLENNIKTIEKLKQQ